jgi:hypothetical protein
MSLFYSYVKCFQKHKDSFFEISNPLVENTISKLELPADFLEGYIGNIYCTLLSARYVGFGTEVWLIPNCEILFLFSCFLLQTNIFQKEVLNLF